LTKLQINNKCYKVNGHKIAQVHSSRPKCVGLYIDDLNWKNHIEYTNGKLLRSVDIFYKIRNELPWQY